MRYYNEILFKSVKCHISWSWYNGSNLSCGVSIGGFIVTKKAFRVLAFLS